MDNQTKFIDKVFLKIKLKCGGGQYFCKPKPKIGMLVLWVGQKCTLRCKNCGNLIPALSQISYDYKLVIKSLKKLLEVADIDYVQIQGGEPFTHKEFAAIIQAVNKLKISKLHISTNGIATIDNKILAALKKVPRISIGISNYECTKERRKSFCAKLEENNIKFNLYNFMYEDNLWFDSGGKDIVRNDKDVDVASLYSSCDNRSCFTLANGYVYNCGKMPSVRELHPEITFSSNTIINLSTSKKMRKEQLNNFIGNQNEFKEECRYCLGTKLRVKPGIQLE